ncbi:MAG: CocE/NonD family hydrolase, partial [Candidatus Hydrogenedentes bacterium]|nr:CocE/NonD family hydrolase [Candidatus Hydrogenedentota bacterium]
DFWNAYNVERRAPDINAPAFFVGGWFDIFNQGTIDAFTSRENNGGPGAKGKNYLIMKWSTHGGDVTTDYKHNPNRFSLNIPLLMAAFFAGNLQGNAGAMSILPKVQYYTMGADTEGAPGNEWRSADAWPPFPTTETAYFLSAEGTLGTSTPTEGAQAYTFDPANPVPTRGGANLILPAGPFDQREVIAGRDDILQFATAPLETPLEITGRVKVKLYISSDAPDTAFTAKLLDLYPPEDGRQIGILDSIRRVKTRLGFDNIAPPLQGADDIVELEIDLQSISWIFDKGHRIGLHISSSNSPRFEVNPNTGADFPSPEAPGVPARNTVHLGGKHPSALYLPVR